MQLGGSFAKCDAEREDWMDLPGDERGKFYKNNKNNNNKSNSGRRRDRKFFPGLFPNRRHPPFDILEDRFPPPPVVLVKMSLLHFVVANMEMSRIFNNDMARILWFGFISNGWGWLVNHERGLFFPSPLPGFEYYVPCTKCQPLKRYTEVVALSPTGTFYRDVVVKRLESPARN